MAPSRGSVHTPLALLIGLLGLAGVVAAALMPWLETPSGADVYGRGPSPVVLWIAVAAAAAALICLRRPGWALLPLLVLLAATAFAVLSTSPGAICVDGVDGDGNPVGFCEQDDLTSAPPLLGVGSALTMLGVGVAWLTRRPRSTAPLPGATEQPRA